MAESRAMVAGVLAIAILAGCATLSGTSAMSDERLLNNIRHVAHACHLYAADYNMYLPSTTTQLSTYYEGDFDLNQVELVTTGKPRRITNPGTNVLLKSKITSKTGKVAVAYVDGRSELVADE